MTDRISCPVCRQRQQLPDDIEKGRRYYCCRCGQMLAARTGFTRLWTVVITLAALLLYLPANTLPILRFYYMGAYNENTVIDGVINLYRSGMWPIATVVFIASVLVPLLKLLGLLYLAVPPPVWDARRRTSLYRFIDIIGPWAMLDVFLVAILVALVKLGDLATVLPGMGLWAFAGVVVLTLIAAQGFEPGSLWIDYGKQKKQ